MGESKEENGDERGPWRKKGKGEGGREWPLLPFPSHRMGGGVFARN